MAKCMGLIIAGVALTIFGFILYPQLEGFLPDLAVLMMVMTALVMVIWGSLSLYDYRMDDHVRR